MALCRRCRDFDIQSFQRDTFKYRGYLLKAVINSADAGCSFCSLLLDYLKSLDDGNQHSYLSISFRKKTGGQLSISPLSKNTVRRDDHFPWLAKDGLNIRSLDAYVSNSRYSRNVPTPSGNTPRAWFQAAADEGIAAHTPQNINGHMIADKSTVSALTLAAIRLWHKKCCLFHERCNRTLSRCDLIDVECAPLPTRCIELRPVCGDEACSDNCDLLLVLTRSEGKKGKYIIFSYRWTQDTCAARTTKDNYQCRCTQGVNYSTPDNITPLFYEAGQLAFSLDVCRRLLAFSAAGMFLQCQTRGPDSVVGDSVQHSLADELEDEEDEERINTSSDYKSRLIGLSGIATELGRRPRRWDYEDYEDVSSQDSANNASDSAYLHYFAGTWLPDV
ncbi:hypothetical protein F5Y07DRAFT_394625 [Xylaria sp. FL0933]|nr:hypothetical protein F5Y07DRAFT_394625 [Xylaria sp. FL0933]